MTEPVSIWIILESDWSNSYWITVPLAIVSISRGTLSYLDPMYVIKKNVSEESSISSWYETGPFASASRNLLSEFTV